MARPNRHVPKDSSRRRVWVYVAVAAFILADVVLIALALNSTQSKASTEPTSAVEPAVVEPVETPTPKVEPAETPAPQADTPINPVPPTRILAALDATTAWRATTGACPAAAAIPELTTDSGTSWKKTDATGATEVTALQRIQVSSGKVASMIGFNQVDCAPQLIKTYIAGDNYKSYPEDVASSWYVDPADRATVHGPDGSFKAPCDSVVVLAPRDATAAAVLCADGRSFATTDAADTWSEPVTLPGAINLTATDTGYLAVSVGRANCAGIELIALTESLDPTPIGCYPVVEPVETLPGNVAVSAAAGTVWLWAGNSLIRSLDAGATWN